MATLEVEVLDSARHMHKENVEHVDGYKDSADSKWIDFVRHIGSPGDSQVRRFLASSVVGIKRVSD